MKYELKRSQIFVVNLTTGLHAEFGFFNCLAALLISMSKSKAACGESVQVVMILATNPPHHPTAPTAKGTAGCLIVWFKAVQFAQKLYIQSSLIGALARGPCSSSLPAKV
jgi:hypothetical protein